MKIISKTFKLFSVLVLVLGLTGCSDDDDNNAVVLQNIVDEVIADPELTSLVAALQQAGLVQAVQDCADCTVLAPTNEAFTAFLNELGLTLENVPQETLQQVLLNHVIGSRVPSAIITTTGSGYTKTLADGPEGSKISLYFEFSDGAVSFNGQSTVRNADIFGTNGVIHKVDAVIKLPTIATFATSNPALGNLVSALALADSGTPTVNWINTVSGTENENLAPFTVFAPTNTAFENLLLELDETGNTALGDLDPGLVDSVLTVHVVASTNVESTELGNLQGNIPTLGGNLALDGTTITDGNGRDINIIAPDLVDVQGINGVVHVIDRVILPPLE